LLCGLSCSVAMSSSRKVLCAFPRRAVRSLVESDCWTSAGLIDTSRRLSSLQLPSAAPQVGPALSQLRRVDSNHEVL
jgi:hypothetical protein